MGMLLDLFRNKWPYTDFHELNADWIISTVRELIETMDSFIQNESISFADPITWNITTQYAKATVVIDSVGNAYLSKQAVPAGIQLNNSEYWQEIFDFTTYTRTANRNLTFNVETNTTRATASYNVDDWLILNDVLYRVTQAIAIDDIFIIAPATGSNIVHFTVEDFIKAWITTATALINQYKNDIDASELAYKNQLAQDIADTTASLQAQLNLAISGATVDSEVINARLGADGVTYPTLGDAIRTQITNTENIFIDTTPIMIDNSFKAAAGVTSLNILDLKKNNYTSKLRNGAIVVNGSHAARINSAALANICSIYLECKPNKYYQLYCNIETVAGTPNCQFGIATYETMPSSYDASVAAFAGHTRINSGNNSYIGVNFYFAANAAISVSDLYLIEVDTEMTLFEKQKEIDIIAPKLSQSNFYYDNFAIHSDGSVTENGVTITKRGGDYIFSGLASASGAYHMITSTSCFKAGDVFYLNYSTPSPSLYLQVNIKEHSTDGSYQNILTKNASGCYRVELPSELYEVDIRITYLSGTTYTNNVISLLISNYENETKRIFRTSQFNNSLIQTIKEAEKYYGSIVLADNSSYDIVAEFVDYYGESFFTSYDLNAPDARGIVISNGMTIKGNSDTIISCDPTQYISDNNRLYLYFSPFMLGPEDCTIEDLIIECISTKYCIHDDWQNNSEKYKHIIRNCKLQHTGSGLRSIGGGFTSAAEVIIENCYFNDNWRQDYPVHYHNSSGNSKSRLYIKNNYFVNGGVGLAHYGTSTEKSIAYISGNSYRIAPHLEFQDQAQYPNENMEYVEWCNELRT